MIVIKKEKEAIRVTLRLGEEAHKKLLELCKKTKASKNSMINLLLINSKVPHG